MSRLTDAADKIRDEKRQQLAQQVALEHLEVATRQGLSLYQIASSIGAPESAARSIPAILRALRMAWLELHADIAAEDRQHRLQIAAADRAFARAMARAQHHQVAAVFNLKIIQVRPRLAELANAGKIVDTGKRGTTDMGQPCIVWGLI